ncbi:MAG: hypothetical protein U5K54_29245 [Cytophagales bacterium]|nr:hypothetical protein [Cytophagales bacterium]
MIRISNFLNLRSTGLLALGILVVAAMLLASCSNPEHENRYAYDSTWAMMPFTKLNDVNPILEASDGVFTCPILNQAVKWEEKDVFNPAAVFRNGAIYLFYRAEDTIGKYAGTSRIGLAMGSDGVNFTRMREPIVYPAEDFMKVYEWEGGIEDPRIVESAMGTYMMTYSAYDGKTARMCLASSYRFA